MKRPRVGGAEQDAFSRWRHVHSWGPGEIRKIKRRAGKRERRTARVIIEQEERPPLFFDAHDLAVIGMYEEYEALEGECRHCCNGDCIVLGTGSDVCDFTCHPGLTADPVKAERFEGKLAELERGSAADALACTERQREDQRRQAEYERYAYGQPGIRL